MDNLRFILIISLGLVSLMLWQEWEKDYGRVVTDSTLPDVNGDGSPVVGTDIPATPAPVDRDGEIMLMPSLAAVERGEFVEVETDVYRIRIGKAGASLNRVELIKYPVSSGDVDQPIVLLNNVDSPSIYIAQGGLLSVAESPTHEATFETTGNRYTLEAGQQELLVPFVWESTSGMKVTKWYAFKRGSYLIDIHYEIDNQSGDVWYGSAYNQLQRKDPGRASYLLYTYTGAVISTPEKRYEKIGFDDMRQDRLSLDSMDGWAAMLQHYFVGAIIPASREEKNHYYTQVHQGDRYIIGAVTPAISVAPGERGMIRQKLYLGPKIQSTLAEIAPGLELTVDYGLLWILAKPLFWCLDKFYGYTGNWGWSIVLVTLMLKLIFFRLSAAGYRSMANMRRVHPRLVAIKERYKNDRARLNQAMMDIYKKEKINPFGGCLPILVPIPVFIALYWMLLESVELRQAAFIFWLTDLSEPDRFYVLPLIMGITMLAQQKLNPTPLDPVQEKIMMILPIVFTVFFAFFPSGLVLYWVVNNILSIAQQWAITRTIEHETVARS